MRVFMTGATGFIGSYLVPELVAAGHHVLGLARTDAGADALARTGAEAVRGDLDDLDHLREAAASTDGVIHAAFNHDFANMKAHSEADRRAIEVLGEALAGSDRPLVVSSGTGLVRRGDLSGPAAETDPHMTADEFPRGATEDAADVVAAAGGHVTVVRLSQVHDPRRQGRIAEHIKIARAKGFVAYVGDGAVRLPAVHVTDASRLFRLALEQGRAGARYHAVGEDGVPFRTVAEVLGAAMGLPVRSITPEEAEGYFGWLAKLAQIDLAATAEATRRELGWEPTGPGLLDDLRAADLTHA